jgi:heptosyltransferase-2
LKILIVKIGAIGDVVMALPILPFIKRKYPNAKIYWIAGELVKDLIAETKLVDEIVTINEKKLLKGSIFERLKEIWKVWRKIGFVNFDITLYYYYSNAYKILTLGSFTKKLVEFSRGKNKLTIPLPGRHHTFEYISTVTEDDGSHSLVYEYPKFSLFAPEHQSIKDKFKHKKCIILSCGGAKNILREDDLRRWPIDRYVALAELLLNEGFEVFLTGSPTDNWITPHFAHLPVHNYIAKFDLLSFISFLKIGDLFVTHDSGPLHLADLAGIPSIGLFGPTPPSSFKSLLPSSSSIWGGEHLTCRPCYDGKLYANCKRPLCIESIPVKQVFELLKTKLKETEVLV